MQAPTAAIQDPEKERERERERERGGHSIGKIAEHIKVCLVIFFEATPTHTLMVLSLDPVANHSFPGSMAMHRTQPRWPLRTLISFHGGCHSGRTVWSARRGTSC